jgi:hypothetical protein
MPATPQPQIQLAAHGPATGEGRASDGGPSLWRWSAHTLARSEQREGSVAWPLLFEAALVITAIAVLIPWFAVLAARDAGRDDRFGDASVAAAGRTAVLEPVRGTLRPRRCRPAGLSVRPRPIAARPQHVRRRRTQSPR